MGWIRRKLEAFIVGVVARHLSDLRSPLRAIVRGVVSGARIEMAQLHAEALLARAERKRMGIPDRARITTPSRRAGA